MLVSESDSESIIEIVSLAEIGTQKTNKGTSSTKKTFKDDPSIDIATKSTNKTTSKTNAYKSKKYKTKRQGPKKDKNVPYDQKRAWNYALWLLGRQLYTRKGIEDKLKKKETAAENIEIILDKLIDYKMLDDENYAIIYVRSRKKGKGRHALKQELKRKGIREEHIEVALDTLDEEEQQEAVNDLLYRNRWRFQDPKKARNKAYAFLQRRGFDSDMIRDALEHSFVDGIYHESEPEFEDEPDHQQLFGDELIDEDEFHQ